MTNIETIKKFATKVLASESIEIGVPLVLEEITFIPIIKHEIPRDERDYLSLSEALEEGACKITDKGTEVAHILFENISEFPILIEEGEIFKGQGTQDRMCVGTIKVEPMKTVEIPVKCVHAPHHLSSGAAFGYGGKAGRGMLKELRSLKFSHAVNKAPASTIDQSRVWDQVHYENVMADVADNTKYTENVEKRRERAEKIGKKLKFPTNTVGVVVVNPEGDVKGLEIHRTPHNFKVRKDGILESIEANISWEPEGKGSFKNAQEKVKELFKKISELKKGKEALSQVEISGLAINLDGVSGEAYTTTFYSGVCPSCNSQKPRQKACPNCGFLEEDMDEIAYMSMY
ncbi:MAG: hypothetical protein EU540_03445 [Promethearchaeota archaeon]|nr:MAG: hypothetical protein EU540_03445 [Candidatus Lokiarchaeota archaeon]